MKLQIIERPIVTEKVVKEFEEGVLIDVVMEELRNMKAEDGKELYIKVNEDVQSEDK